MSVLEKRRAIVVERARFLKDVERAVDLIDSGRSNFLIHPIAFGLASYQNSLDLPQELAHAI